MPLKQNFKRNSGMLRITRSWKICRACSFTCRSRAESGPEPERVTPAVALWFLFALRRGARDRRRVRPRFQRAFSERARSLGPSDLPSVAGSSVLPGSALLPRDARMRAAVTSGLIVRVLATSGAWALLAAVRCDAVRYGACR